MKTQLLTLIGFAISLLANGQNPDLNIKLKEINSIELNTSNGDKITKNYSFDNGKLKSIKTSDIIQNFFYNNNGTLDKTVRENEAFGWKEIANYEYDENGNLIKYTNKYDEGSKSVTKTVSFSYEGTKIRAVTKKSNSTKKYVQWIDYTLQEGKIVSESERDLSQKIISNKRIDYNENDIVAYKGLLGDRSMDNYDYDTKNSAMLLLVQNVFGENYQTIITLIAPHEKEFPLESMANHNFVKFTSTKPSKNEYSNVYTYNNFGYPKTHTQLNGGYKTMVTYEYE